ncbi:MAG TPA: helix-turn-helix domain-containing protein [Methylomirabilota bacterium]|nr:helix-turn-helix domain-containing protein [Methylomirabilota bacterium]
MRITAQLTDESVLEELGGRLAGARLGRNLTQAALADQAGVSKRTVERLEAGAVATQLSGFLRVCRTLGLLERFESLIPEAAVSPMAQLKQAGRKRQRATGKKAAAAKPKKWAWGEPA